ncbi:cytochrome P450 [Streptomyces sp. NBC_01803]|uniref:cytochrome P450 n=1 Tax=Streptomyces sp. NBC_01803 TaxID=2975946 RepID=UPI002DD9A73C|nr:cytochrome P450 [Streptomyces sp. NBC_01803]WSA42971.1 cytochrome P450 [Streptomyces sp. NBC_01803]
MSDYATALDPDAPQVLPYNPFDPEFHANPYKVFKGLREEKGNVIRTPAGISVLGFAETSQVMMDRKLGRGDGAGVQDTLVMTDEGPQRAFMFMDPPDHTRIRKLVTKVFNARTVERLRPQAERFAAERMAALAARADSEPVDLVSEFFRPLGTYVVNVLMGVPAEYLDRSIEYAKAAERGLDPTYTLNPEEQENRTYARDGYMDIARELIVARRAKPNDDLMSHLIAAEEDGDRLTTSELLTTAAVLFLPGFLAPQGLMGLSTLALLRNPDQLSWLRDHLDQAASASEELIRFDTTLQIMNRTVLEKTDVGGVELEPGEEVFCLLGAANHDPAAFERPEELDLSRPVTRHIGFGHGIHFCVAAPVARLANEVMISELSRHRLTLVDENPPTNGSLSIRSLSKLRVAFEKSA